MSDLLEHLLRQYDREFRGREGSFVSETVRAADAHVPNPQDREAPMSNTAPKTRYAICPTTGFLFNGQGATPAYAIPLVGLEMLPPWVHRVDMARVNAVRVSANLYSIEMVSRAVVVRRATAGEAWAEFIRSCVERYGEKLTSPVMAEVAERRVIALDMRDGRLIREGMAYPAAAGDVVELCRPLDAPEDARWINVQRIRMELGDGNVWRVIRDGKPVGMVSNVKGRALGAFLETHPHELKGKRPVATAHPRWDRVAGRIGSLFEADMPSKPEYVGVEFKHDPERTYAGIDYAAAEARIMASFTGMDEAELHAAFDGKLNTPATREQIKAKLYRQIRDTLAGGRVRIPAALKEDMTSLYGPGSEKVELSRPLHQTADMHVTMHRGPAQDPTRVDSMEDMTRLFGVDTAESNDRTGVFVVTLKNRENQGPVGAGPVWEIDPAYLNPVTVSEAPRPSGPFHPSEFAHTQIIGAHGLASGVHPAFERAIPSPQPKEPDARVSMQWSGDQTPQALDRKARFVQAVRDSAALFPTYTAADWWPFLKELHLRVGELRFVGEIGVKAGGTDAGTMAVRFVDKLGRDGYRCDLQIRVDHRDRDTRRGRLVEVLRTLTAGGWPPPSTPW